jgi:hypothetical protein
VPKNRYGLYPNPATLRADDWIGLVPYTVLTPGVIDTCLHAVDICTTKTKERRHTTGGQKTESLRLYEKQFGRYSQILSFRESESSPEDPIQEFDHLISLELAGADTDQNLWPQPTQSLIAGASDKDQIENHLKGEMCKILETEGESLADSYLAMMQRVVAAGFSVDKQGQIVPPPVSWYTLYYYDILPYTDGHGKLLKKKKNGRISFADTLIKYRVQIRGLPAPLPVDPNSTCQPPQP